MPSRLSIARYTPKALKTSRFKCKLLIPSSRNVRYATTYLFNPHIFHSNQNTLQLHYSLPFEVSYGLHIQIQQKENHKLQSKHTFRLNLSQEVEASWNVMAHAQKPDFVFRPNGRVHLNRQGASVQSTTGSRGVRISDSNAGYTMFRGSVKGTGYPLHSPVSPSLSPRYVTVCHHISTGVYLSAIF